MSARIQKVFIYIHQISPDKLDHAPYYFLLAAKQQLQPDLTTERGSQPLENDQMTTIRSSQSPLFVPDSESSVTTADLPVFTASLCGNLSMPPLTVKSRKCPYFKPFSRYRPHFLDSRTTVSGVTFSAGSPEAQKSAPNQTGKLNSMLFKLRPSGCFSG